MLIFMLALYSDDFSCSVSSLEYGRSRNYQIYAGIPYQMRICGSYASVNRNNIVKSGLFTFSFLISDFRETAVHEFLSAESRLY